MSAYTSFMFAFSAAAVFGVVSGAVAGASELAHRRTSSEDATVTELPVATEAPAKAA
jgi:hypothetical protein